MIVIFVTLCALAVISFCILSPTSGYIAVPPDGTVLAHRSLGVVLYDGGEGGFTDATGFHGRTPLIPDLLIVDGDCLALRHFLALLQGKGGCSNGHFLLEI